MASLRSGADVDRVGQLGAATAYRKPASIYRRPLDADVMQSRVQACAEDVLQGRQNCLFRCHNVGDETTADSGSIDFLKPLPVLWMGAIGL